MKTAPTLQFESAAAARGFAHIAGVDEVGRGPLAGPVTAAAVILDPARLPKGINDSKKLTARARARLAQEIRETAHACAVVHVGVEQIDQLNILHASLLAMRLALAELPIAADFALIDGNRAPRDLPIPSECIVKGDAHSLSIAAASILAKVARDELMAELAAHFPGYGWEKNAGYPSPAHLAALTALGVTPHHRRSFAPVRKILC